MLCYRGICYGPVSFRPFVTARIVESEPVFDIQALENKGNFPLVAQRVERWTCDQQVVGSNPTRGKSCVTTLGNLFTPMCLCHQAV